MQLLTPTSAKYFCGTFTGNAASSKLSIKEFLGKQPRTKRIYQEGTPSYSLLHDCILREADRSLFLSNSLYATALQGNRESNSWWGHVTLYYSAFFAARGLLAMHGGWINDKDYWLQVTNSTPGAITLEVNRTAHPQLTTQSAKSTHKAFWKVFYWAVRSLHTHAPNNLAFALNPVQSRDSWLIDTRNELNYQPSKAFDSIEDFITGFNPTSIPNSLPKHWVVIHNTTSALIELAIKWKLNYNLSADVLINHFPTLNDASTAIIKFPRNSALDTYAHQRIQGLPL